MILTEQQAIKAAEALSVDFTKTRYTLEDFIHGLKAFDTSYQKGVKNRGGKTEYKTLHFELEDFDEEQGIFSGYAAVFGNVDSGGDVIEPGAFTKTIAEGWERVKILALHNDYDLPIGRPLELREDAHGLYIKGKISETAMGKDVKTLLRDKVLNEMSIGYDPVVFDYDKEDGIRHLREVKLWEVSIVTWAMNPDAVVTGYKTDAIADRATQMMQEVSADLKDGRKISTVRIKSLKEAAATMKGTVKILETIIKEAENSNEGQKRAPSPPNKKQEKLPSPTVEIVFN